MFDVIAGVPCPASAIFSSALHWCCSSCSCLTALYVVLYVLLSLKAYSLLIGSLMLFVALALVMYLTWNLNWVGRDDVAEEVT